RAPARLGARGDGRRRHRDRADRTPAQGMTVDAQQRKRAAVADRKAREFLRNADPVLARLIDARPGFRPRAWMDELPPLDAFGTLVFQGGGQQPSARSTRAIIRHLEERFGGHMPSAAELLAADPNVLRESGF